MAKNLSSQGTGNLGSVVISKPRMECMVMETMVSCGEDGEWEDAVKK